MADNPTPAFTVSVGFQPLPNLKGTATQFRVSLIKVGERGGEQEFVLMSWEQWAILVETVARAKDFVTVKQIPGPKA